MYKVRNRRWAKMTPICTYKTYKFNTSYHGHLDSLWVGILTIFKTISKLYKERGRDDITTLHLVCLRDGYLHKNCFTTNLEKKWPSNFREKVE